MHSIGHLNCALARLDAQSVRCAPCVGASTVARARSARPFGTVTLDTASTSTSRPFTTTPTAPLLRKRHSERRVSWVANASRDFYKILGVERGADKKSIKSAYRQLARKYHPDVNKEAGAEDKFKDVSAAYEVLSDDDKRAVYDRFGEEGLEGGGMGAAGFDRNPFEIFEQFFGGMDFGGFGQGGRSAGPRPIPGGDRKHSLTLEFKEAVFGCEKEIQVMRLEACGTCEGSGSKPGTKAQRCGACGGSGQQAQAVRTPLGVFQQVSPCGTCAGTGEVRTPCGSCGGEGRQARSKPLRVSVPPGLDDGSRLRLRGEGDAGRRGGAAGDLYVLVSVRPMPGLRRQGADVHSDAEVSYVQALLGTSVPVSTVDGQVDLRVPPGTQPGTTLVMARRGVPRLGRAAQRGDHLVRVQVAVPKKLGERERALVEQIAALHAERAAEAEAAEAAVAGASGEEKKGWFG